MQILNRKSQLIAYITLQEIRFPCKEIVEKGALFEMAKLEID